MQQLEIKVKHLHLGSFIKWNIYISLTFGIIFGLLFAIISLLGGNVNSTFNGKELSGVVEIIFLLLFTPFLIIIFGAFFSLILYLPMVLILKITKGINLKGIFEIETKVISNKELEVHESNIEKDRDSN